MGSLGQYFDLYQLPTGRRLYAMRALAEIAELRELGEIAALAAAAAAQAEKSAELEATWRRSRSTQEGRRKRANELDIEIDRTLGGITAQLAAYTHAFGEEGVGEQAAQLSRRLLPEGAAVVTNMTFENELAAVEVLLKDLKGELREDAGALGLGPYVDRLEQLARDFGEALKTEALSDITFDQVRQAQTQGQDAYLRVVAKILGDFSSASTEDLILRTELLAPVMSQNRRMRERFTARRPVVDINPETGDELPDESAQPSA